MHSEWQKLFRVFTTLSAKGVNGKEVIISYVIITPVFQDLFVDRLVERVDKLKEEIAMYEAQLTAQLEETKAAKEALMEAHMEIEVKDRPILLNLVNSYFLDINFSVVRTKKLVIK